MTNASNGAGPARAVFANDDLCVCRMCVRAGRESRNPEGPDASIGYASPSSGRTSGREHNATLLAAGFFPLPARVEIYPVPLAIPGGPDWLPRVDAYRAAA